MNEITLFCNATNASNEKKYHALKEYVKISRTNLRTMCAILTQHSYSCTASHERRKSQKEKIPIYIYIYLRLIT